MPALQADALAPLGLHAQLQPIEAVESPDALLVDGPALPAQHHVHAQITEAWSIHGDLPNPKSQGALITRGSWRTRPTDAAVPGGMTVARSLGSALASRLPARAAWQPSELFSDDLCRICLSSVRSATSRFNREFSSSSILRRLTSVTPRSAYFFFFHV